MKHQMSLEYTLGEGWLAPWIEGLRAGDAVASVCSACAQAMFPPLRFCPVCQAPCDTWRTLEGGAEIIVRTVGADGDFALARFDGASSAAVVQAGRLPAGATRGVLMPVPEGPPVLRLGPEPEA